MNVVHVIFVLHVHIHTYKTEKLLLDLFLVQSSRTNPRTQTTVWQIKMLFTEFDNKWIIGIMNYVWKILSKLRTCSRDQTHVSCISCTASGFFTHWATEEAQAHPNISKTTEYKTRTRLRYPSKETVLILFALRGKKKLRSVTVHRLRTHLSYYLQS